MKDLRGFWKESNAPAVPKASAPAKPLLRAASNRSARRAEKLKRRKAERAKKRHERLGRILSECGEKQPRMSPDYVRNERFYKSESWRRLRYIALKNAQGTCQCCGAKATDGVQLHVDHVKPRYTHPHLELKLENLQVLCQDCNIGKGAWDSTDWRQHMRSIISES